MSLADDAYWHPQATNGEAKLHSRDLARTSQRVMKAAGLTVQGFNREQARHFFGQQCAEMASKLRALSDGALTPSGRQSFSSIASSLETLRDETIRGLHEGDIMRADHAVLLESDFALAIASISAMFSTATDAEGAIAHGCSSLFDQFEIDDKGELHLARDEKGQPKSRDGWKEPDFGRFVADI